MNKKIIAPICTAVAMLGLAVGSTFALFTDKGSADINVLAGQVKIDYSMTLDVAESRYLDLPPYDAVAAAEGSDFDAIFENGGTAKVLTTEDSLNLKLDRLAPMDMIALTAKAKNKSDINIRHRYSIVLDGELVPALQVVVDGTDYSTADTHLEFTSCWSSVATPDVEQLCQKDIRVYFPYGGDEQNFYQGKECDIKVSVEAIQGNAHVEDPEDEDIEIPEYEQIHGEKPSTEEKFTYMFNSNGTVSTKTSGKSVAPETEELILNVENTGTPVVDVPTGKECLALDVEELGLKDDNDVDVEVGVKIGSGKEGVEVYHDGTLIDSTYDSNNGLVEFATKSFSPFDILWNSLKNKSYGFFDSYIVDEGLETEHWVHEISNPTEFRNMWMDKYFQENSEHYPGYLQEETVYCLINDVDFEGDSTYGENFATWQSYAFSGIFDGQGYTLKDIINNETYKDTDRIGGMFSNLGRPVEIKDLVLDDIHLVQKNSDKGVGIISGGLEYSTASETLVINNVETTSLCSIESNEKTGGFIGCCRGYQSVTITDCINATSIVSAGKNSGGFLGTSSYTKEFYFTNCESKGKILSTNSDGYVAGFVSQSQSATKIALKDCIYSGEVDNRSGGANISFFMAVPAGTVTYENCLVSGMLTVKNASFVNELSKIGISASDGTLADHVNVVNCAKIEMSFDETQSLNITPVANADHYEVSLNFSCLKGTVSGDTFTQTNDSDFVYDCGSYADAEALKEVKLVTRVGHVLDNAVTNFDTHYASQGVSSNHYRLSELGDYVANTPTKEEGVDGWYVVFGNTDEVKFINFYETVWLTYNIIAKDSTGVVIGSSSWKIGGYSASPLMNMAGQWYRGTAPHYTPIIL